MGQVYSIACGLPVCRGQHGHQTKLSIGFRITAIAVGIIAIITAALIQCGIPNLAQLGSSVAWPVLSIGIALVILAAALKCVKKQSASGSHLDQQSDSHRDQSLDSKHESSLSTSLTSRNLGILDVKNSEASVKNGYGEFVVFSKSGQMVDPEKYTSAYKIFDKFSLAHILKNNAPVEVAIETFGKREQIIEQELQTLDPDLSAFFIPKTLYELVFIHACIEEDITAGSICSLLKPDTQKIIHGYEDADLDISEDQKQQYVEKLKQRQAKRKCWHLCYFDDLGDSMHPKVIEVAYRLNQLIINKIQNLQALTFSDVTSLLNSEIKFLEEYHKHCSVLTEKMNKDATVTTSISSCTTPGPTTNFGYETIRGSIKPMGIRNCTDAKILRKAVSMECSEAALKNIFLFRGSHFKEDKPYYLDKTEDPYSLSFGTSLFSGVVYDGGATAFHYMRQDGKEAFAVIVPMQELANVPFYVPLTSTVCQLFGHGEIFHARSKVWQGVIVGSVQNFTFGPTRKPRD